jgi:VanZ family protein
MAAVNADPGVLKPLRHPRFWLGLWALAIALVIAVCLMPPPPLPPLPNNSDKVEHLLGYFLLAGSAVQLFAGRRALLVAALGLVALGIGIEFAQGLLTTDRLADPLDALANTAGVALGLGVRWTPWRDLLLRWERRVWR